MILSSCIRISTIVAATMMKRRGRVRFSLLFSLMVFYVLLLRLVGGTSSSSVEDEACSNNDSIDREVFSNGHTGASISGGIEEEGGGGQGGVCTPPVHVHATSTSTNDKYNDRRNEFDEEAKEKQRRDSRREELVNDPNGIRAQSKEQQHQSSVDVSSQQSSKENNHHTSVSRSTITVVPDDCTLVMAPSSIPYNLQNSGDDDDTNDHEEEDIYNTAGWGIFSLVDRSKGRPILWGDVVIQMNDFDESKDQQVPDALSFLIQDYGWSASETGGQYEGQHTVMSIVPGIGMLANGVPNHLHNALFFVPSVDEGGLTRSQSPGAGAISHYHNLTFFTTRPITAGTEIMVHFGSQWYTRHEQNEKQQEEGQQQQQPPGQLFQPTSLDEMKKYKVGTRNVKWLRQHGRCLDNMRPGRSTVPNAGRGVFATRPLRKGTIVAPVPILPITDRRVMDIMRQYDETSTTMSSSTKIKNQQLLMNYCLGHPNTSLLFYPYSPMVNLVNHGRRHSSSSGENVTGTANVQLQWSSSNVLHHRGLEWIQKGSIDFIRTVHRSGLLLELVATRDIQINEEILLNYGLEWEKAWDDHIKHWKPMSNAKYYLPSFVQDDAIKALRTEEELVQYPYPDNLFTSCFYRFADNRQAAIQQQQLEANDKNKVTTFAWKNSRGLFELRYMRPCRILQRENNNMSNPQDKGGTRFKVQILNRIGLPSMEQIPNGMIHIVTNVPRYAIRFSDKVYSTDQHLPNAFRHVIGFPNELYPEQWKDLL